MTLTPASNNFTVVVTARGVTSEVRKDDRSWFFFNAVASLHCIVSQWCCYPLALSLASSLEDCRSVESTTHLQAVAANMSNAIRNIPRRLLAGGLRRKLQETDPTKAALCQLFAVVCHSISPPDPDFGSVCSAFADNFVSGECYIPAGASQDEIDAISATCAAKYGIGVTCDVIDDTNLDTLCDTIYHGLG